MAISCKLPPTPKYSHAKCYCSCCYFTGLDKEELRRQLDKDVWRKEDVILALNNDWKINRNKLRIEHKSLGDIDLPIEMLTHNLKGVRILTLWNCKLSKDSKCNVGNQLVSDPSTTTSLNLGGIKNVHVLAEGEITLPHVNDLELSNCDDIKLGQLMLVFPALQQIRVWNSTVVIDITTHWESLRRFWLDSDTVVKTNNGSILDQNVAGKCLTDICFSAEIEIDNEVSHFSFITN